LRRKHRVISLDIPGFGLTGPFPVDDYRIEHYTRFMGAVLDRLGIKHAALVGNSLGGYIAWQTALARPDLVERLVLIDARGYPIDEKTLPIAWRIARIPVLRSLMNRIPPRGFVEKGVLRVYGNRSNVTAALVDRYYEMTMRAGNRRALTVIFQQQSFDDWSRITKIAIPTLILWGRLDCQAPLSDAERFHKDIADSRLVIFDKLGHVPQEEDPVESIKPLEFFLGDRIDGEVEQPSLRQAAR
jgi:pimeloyl-ACP methyl ester carboxylesterase